MLSYITFIPGVLAYLLANRRSVPFAFLRVYLPVVLLLPDYYRAITPGIPDPNFSQSAGVGLFIAYAMAGFPGFVFSATDLWVLFYAFCVGYSEYRASGYADAQNLIFGMLFGGIAPYVFAKGLIEPYGLRVVFTKVCVLCFSFVACVDVIETRLGFNAWRWLFDRFFPGQGQSWVTTFRFGLARAAGPYAHALLNGIMMLVAFRMQRWLEWTGAWPADWPARWRWMPIKPARMLTLIVTGGLVFSLAKGSWLASSVGATLTAVGRVKSHRFLAMVGILSALVLVGIPAAAGFIAYASVGRENAKDANQETSAYRYEMIEDYIDIAAQEPLWGWGLTKWPAIPGMASIDNHYLLLLLMHGRLAMVAFLYLLLGTMIRLVVYGMRQPPGGPRGGALSFTLAGIFVGYTIAIATVFMGQQTIPMFFMLVGWAESYMIRRTPEGGGTAIGPFNFRRVL
ncbi:O-antigen ligase domain-containing protein [Methylolobus aquaticus]|nr:O-antigen ligase domain-containing protein [Methylolobus aquaticus]